MVSHPAARWRGLVRFSWLGPTFSNAWILCGEIGTETALPSNRRMRSWIFY
jgi:hypothetical protein